MYKKFIITIILILAVLSIGCSGVKALNPTKKLSSNEQSKENNDTTNNIPYKNDVKDVQNTDNVPSVNNVEDNKVTSVNNNHRYKPIDKRVYKYYTVRTVDGREGPKDVSVKVDITSWKMDEFIKNNQQLSEMFLSKVRSGSQKIKGDNGRIRFYIDSNGDIYGLSRMGGKDIYKKYLGPVLVKHTDPDYPGIHKKYVVGMLYKVLGKDTRSTETFEYHRLSTVGEYEVLIFVQDKTNVPNRKTIYIDTYRIDPNYDLNPENFYNDLPRIGGAHKRTRLINWREYIFSN